MRKALLAIVLVSLAACATPYGKYGALGGYTDSRIDENTFTISVDTNGFTSQQTTSMHAMYRAAELTVENGFDFFVIANTANDSKSMAMTMPTSSTSTTTVSRYGSGAMARTTTNYGPVTTMPVAFPNSTLVIKSFKGTKPDQGDAYDAREVMTYLGPQIGASGTK